MTREIIIKFVRWTKLKYRMHTGDGPKFRFKEREVWWCSLGANIGYEQDGKNERFERPVLVLRKFNNDLLWVLPLTRQGKDTRFYFKLSQGVEDSFVILSQIRTISRRRLVRWMYRIPREEFLEIKERVRHFL